MTHATKRARIRPALPAAALAALLLAGCSTGHIGESWQCPLAEGGLCDSVAAADPAVPDAEAAGTTALAEPLWRVRASETDAPPARGEPAPPASEPGGQAAEPSCATDCGVGFDPFAWLARLFAAEAHEDDTRPAGRPAPAVQPSDPASGGEAEAPAGPDAALPARTEAAEEDAGAALRAAAERAGGDPDDGDLRTGEVVARIWIAPFVDGNGVYREASHVRVVLEPAAWRLR